MPYTSAVVVEMETEPSDITNHCQCAAATTMVDGSTTTDAHKSKHPLSASKWASEPGMEEGGFPQPLASYCPYLSHLKSGSEEVGASDKKLNKMTFILR